MKYITVTFVNYFDKVDGKDTHTKVIVPLKTIEKVLVQPSGSTFIHFKGAKYGQRINETLYEVGQLISNANRKM